MNQKAILTLSDKAAGTIDVRIEFKPSIDPNKTTSPAVNLAVQLMNHIGELADNEEE